MFDNRLFTTGKSSNSRLILSRVFVFCTVITLRKERIIYLLGSMFIQFFVLLMVTFVCCQDNVIDVAKQFGASTLVKLLQDAELSSVLKGQGTISSIITTEVK